MSSVDQDKTEWEKRKTFVFYPIGDGAGSDCYIAKSVISMRKDSNKGVDSTAYEEENRRTVGPQRKKGDTYVVDKCVIDRDSDPIGYAGDEI
jgi:hypothetical protein